MKVCVAYPMFETNLAELLWKQRPSKISPWIPHDLDTKGRRLMSLNELFNIF